MVMTRKPYDKPEADRISRLYRAVRATVVVQVVGVGVTYVLNVLLARWLGTVDYGGYLFITNLLIASAVFAGLGLRLSTPKFVPELITQAEWRLLAGYLWLLPRLTLGVGSLLALGLVLLFWLSPPADIPLQFWLFGVPLLPLYACMDVSVSLLRSLGQVSPALALDRIVRPMLLLLSMALSMWLLPWPTASVALLALWLAVIGALLLLALRIRAVLLRVAAWPVAARDYSIRRWLHTSLRLLLVMLKALSVDRLPVLIVGLLLGAAPTALYGVAFRLATLARFGSDAVHQVYEPQVAPLYLRGDYAALQRTLIQVTRWSLYSTCVLCAGLLLLAQPLLALFGAAYVEASGVLVVALLAQLVRGLFGPLVYLLNLTDHEHLSLRVSIGVTLLACVALPLAIGRFGLLGAAWVVVGVELIGNVGFHWLVLRHLGINGLPPEVRWLLPLHYIVRQRSQRSD